MTDIWLRGILSIVSLESFGKKRKDDLNMAILHPDKNEFEALVKEEGVLFVDFFADWCGPCKMLAPEMEKLAAEFEGKAKVVKINVDQHQDLAAEFRVQSIPALYVIKNGKIVSQDLGYKPYPALQSMLYRVI